MKLELPYLFTYEISESGIVTVSLKLKPEEYSELELLFQPIQEGREIRLRLEPQEGVSWMLYFKRKESESRCMAAHPSPEEWVGTVGLSAPVLSSLLRALSEKSYFNSLEYVPPSPLNNLCFQLSLRELKALS